jgi:predicted Zn finger-like uncharacterized protein
MIIECINCNKIFEVNSELIPSTGRTIQCGACNHIWFYKPNQSIKKEINDTSIIKKKLTKSKRKTVQTFNNETLSKEIDDIINKKDKALIKYEKKSKFTFLNLLGYIIVAIISFIALIIILDTFQTQLINFYPDLELILFSLYETIEDIYLFLQDLIK